MPNRCAMPILFVAGRLSLESGGPPTPLDDTNTRRTIYGYVGRTTLDPMLSLFDFPNPNNTSETAKRHARPHAAPLLHE
jgi:hypothetical protein